jgi:hypothetical protein
MNKGTVSMSEVAIDKHFIHSRPRLDSEMYKQLEGGYTYEAKSSMANTLSEDDLSHDSIHDEIRKLDNAVRSMANSIRSAVQRHDIEGVAELRISLRLYIIALEELYMIVSRTDRDAVNPQNVGISAWW